MPRHESLIVPPKLWGVPALKVIVLRRNDELSDSSTLYTNPREVFSMLRGVPLRAAHFYGRAAAKIFQDHRFCYVGCILKSAWYTANLQMSEKNAFSYNFFVRRSNVIFGCSR